MPSRRDLLRSAGLLPFAGAALSEVRPRGDTYDLDPKVTYLNHASIGTRRPKRR